MYYIVIRESRPEDTPAISEVVRKAYLSNVYGSWLNALFREVVFQFTILLAAVMFILLGVPFLYCVLSVPMVLVGLYIVIYGSLLMKSAQVMYDRKPLQCWVAEAYQPFFMTRSPEECSYKIIPEEKIQGEDIKTESLQRKIIGTVAVMSHLQHENMGWLFRLAVDRRYRRKGVGLQLVQTVKSWSRSRQLNYLELVISECQEGSRELFSDAGFEIKQLYHKKFLVSAIILQMFQLRCEVRPNF